MVSQCGGGGGDDGRGALLATAIQSDNAAAVSFRHVMMTTLSFCAECARIPEKIFKLVGSPAALLN